MAGWRSSGTIVIPASNRVTGVRVDLGARSYDVLVGPGARSELADMVPVSARQAIVVTQAGIGVAGGLEHGAADNRGGGAARRACEVAVDGRDAEPAFCGRWALTGGTSSSAWAGES